jgi:hypothetical protein
VLRFVQAWSDLSRGKEAPSVLPPKYVAASLDRVRARLLHEDPRRKASGGSSAFHGTTTAFPSEEQELRWREERGAELRREAELAAVAEPGERVFCVLGFLGLLWLVVAPVFFVGDLEDEHQRRFAPTVRSRDRERVLER